MYGYDADEADLDFEIHSPWVSGLDSCVRPTGSYSKIYSTV